MKPRNVLILPGWQNSGPAHWQSRWESAHGYRRVDQHDWMAPQRGDWMARLEDVVLATDGPVVFAAHSLGCMLVAAWAAHSKNTARVRGALLVAPGDPETDALQAVLPSWSPVVRRPLPFPAVLVGSRDDPYCGFDRAQGMATVWGARFIDLGNAGHINADTGLGDWPQGHAWLIELMKDPH